MAKKAKASAVRRTMVSVRINADQFAALKALSKETGAPWAYYVRQGIDLVLEKHRKKRG